MGVTRSDALNCTAALVTCGMSLYLSAQGDITKTAIFPVVGVALLVLGIGKDSKTYKTVGTTMLINSVLTAPGSLLAHTAYVIGTDNHHLPSVIGALTTGQVYFKLFSNPTLNKMVMDI